MKVPQYQADQVTPQGLPGERFDPRAPIGAFGGGQATEGAFAQARGMAQDSAAIFADQAKEAAQQADNDVLNQARVDLNDQERAMKEKVSALKGRDALGTTSTLNEDLRKYSADYESKLYTPEQKQAYRQMVTARREYLLNWGNDREVQAKDELHVGGLKAGTASSIERAASDPSTVPLESGMVDDNALALAKFHGLDKTQTALSRAQAQSDLHYSVLKRMVDGGQESAARDYYGEWKGNLIGEQADHMAKAMQNVDERGRAQTELMKIFAPKESVTQTGEMKWTVDKTEPTEGETFAAVDKIKDPKLQDDVRARVRQRWEDIKRAKDDDLKADTLKAANIIEGTPTLDAIPADVFERLPLTTRRALLDRAKQVKAGEAPPALSDRYFELLKEAGANPDKFTKRDLTLERSKVAGPELKQLAEHQSKILSGDGSNALKLRGFLSMQEDAKLTLRSMGVTDEEDTASFLRALNRDYMTWKANPKNIGKEPDEDASQSLIGKLINQDRLWGFLWKRTHLLAPKYDEIPAAERTAIEGQLKKNGEPPTRGRVIELFQKANQK